VSVVQQVARYLRIFRQHLLRDRGVSVCRNHYQMIIDLKVTML
jgi:hypothetical protein